MEPLKYNFFNTLIFSGIIYGIVFSFINLIRKNFKSNARTYLVITVLFLTISNLQYWLIDVGFRELYHVPKVVYIQFELLIIPVFYVFVCEYLQERVSKKKILLLAIPFLIGMTYQFFVYSTNLERALLRKYNLVVEIATIAYSVVLIVLSFQKVRRYEKNQNSSDSGLIGIKTSWINHYLLAAIGVFLIWIIATQIFYSTDILTLDMYYPLWISISVIIYWMGNKGISELRIYHERRSIRNAYREFPKEFKRGKKLLTKGDRLFQNVISDLKNEKLYLDTHLNLNDLAARYGVSSGYLSQIVSKNSDEGLVNIVNGLRIEEAKKMLSDKSFNNYTIESIGLESGFGTKANFYKTFKKHTGLTPKQYKNV
ncbi:MAG: helix-turn-helix domain-containing protein [Bacteroidota bacterium]